MHRSTTTCHFHRVFSLQINWKLRCRSMRSHRWAKNAVLCHVLGRKVSSTQRTWKRISTPACMSGLERVNSVRKRAQLWDLFPSCQQQVLRKTRQSIRSSDHLKDNLGSPHQIHRSDRIDHNPSIHPSLSNIANSEAPRTSNQENRNSNKKQNQQKMTTTTTTTTPYPTRASIHALFQNTETGKRRPNLQASLIQTSTVQ
jgi:hypothetical protein